MAMRQVKGVTMKVFGVVLAAALLTTGSDGVFADANEVTSSGAFAEISSPAEERAIIDAAQLISAARGAPAPICALAAQSVNNGGWDNLNDAPATPLGVSVRLRDDNGRSSQMSAQDVELLLGSLSSDDACVREIAVRLLGRRSNAAIDAG